MRIDVVTIFPEYLAPLELSLLGKARTKGTLEVHIHDLRAWTTDKHRTVDDTPAGGGAGMVMRPDIWGKALDDVIAAGNAGGLDTSAAGSTSISAAASLTPSDTPTTDPAPAPLLLIPTPAGTPLTQATAERWAGRDRLIFACGRYEGIDARVADEYGERIDVEEFSLGDYVLNGGEVAALVAIEAVGRLVGGVVGNPESLVEESHGSAGLLEYPVYTRPQQWRGHTIPAVLNSGDHGRVARWRRAQALARTAVRRPDMLARAPLTMADKITLVTHGYALLPDGQVAPVRLRKAELDDAAELSALARRTFPDACPPELPQAARQEFMDAYLQTANFVEYLSSERYGIWVAEVAGQMRAYCLVIYGLRPEDEEGVIEVAHHLPRGPVAEVSKFYADAAIRSTGITRALMAHAMGEVARAHPELKALWLGTNRTNLRAIRFYERCGWKVTGRRTFDVGGDPQDDVIITVTKLAKWARTVAD